MVWKITFTTLDAVIVTIFVTHVRNLLKGSYANVQGTLNLGLFSLFPYDPALAMFAKQLLHRERPDSVESELL